MRILVVEDDRSVRETLGMVLETYGYQPDLVESGNAGLVYLESRWPELILLDLTLHGMSGEEFYEEVLKRFGRVPPTLVLSADQYGAVRTQKMPGAGFLAKPYTLDELVGVIEKMIAAHRRAEAKETA